MSTKRFRIALSFAGENRAFIKDVADILAGLFSQDEILYDHYHRAEFSNADLAFNLPKLYHNDADLVVVVLCPDYDKKEWCGLEWRAIYDLIKKRQAKDIMLLRFGYVVGDGLFSLAGYTDLEQETPDSTARLILERLAINENRPRDYYTKFLTVAAPVGPIPAIDVNGLLQRLDGLSDVNQKLVLMLSDKEQENKALKEMVDRATQGNFIDAHQLNIELDNYRAENDKLRADNEKLKETVSPVFAPVLEEADKRLAAFDNGGYQQVLQNYKNKAAAIIADVAQASYLQALNNESNFLYEEALQQVEEALHYASEEENYLHMKARLLGRLYRLNESIDAYKKLASVAGNEQTKATYYNDIGYFYHNGGAYDTAIEYFEKALDSREKVLGKDHPETAISYNNIGETYRAKGAYDTAIEYFEKALVIREKVLGKEHPNTATSYNNIGEAYRAKGAYDTAIEYYQKALGIWEKVLGKEHPNTATSYNNIGAAYRAKGDYDTAIEYYQKDLAITEKVLGKEHPDTAISYNNIGVAYNDKGDYAQARHYIALALSIYEAKLGAGHPDTKAIKANLGTIA